MAPKTPSWEKLNDAGAPVQPRPDRLVSEAGDGTIIGERYKVLKTLGVGGMSTVYQARHLHLDKIFALKILHQISESSVKRFQMEAKAITLLEHPNIVRVHDFGITNGQPFMIMDCVEGESLADSIKAGGMPIERITKLFGQICSALAHAHEQGVVHRDLKPSNILIKVDEASGVEHAIVADFGIAKILDSGAEGESPVVQQNLTRTGDIFGTPMYMSPEQSLGHKVDERSDIYSLGCVMYEAATGKPPFEGESIYHTIHKQITESPPPFPAHLRKTSAGRRLEALVLKALAKAPGDRHKYMLELASELKAIENKNSGFWSDLKSLSAINFIGRLRATDRKNVLSKALLQLAIVVSIFVCAALTLLPGQLSSVAQRIERNDAIIQMEAHVFDFKSRQRSMFYTAELVPVVERIEELCGMGDPAQRVLCADFSRRSLQAFENGRIKMRYIKEAITGNIFGASRNTYSLAQRAFTEIAVSWGDANLAGTKLREYSQAQISRDQHSSVVMSCVLLLAIVLAPICAISLGVFLFKIIQRKIRERR